MNFADYNEPCIDCGAVAPPPTMHPARRCETRGTYPDHYPVDLGPICADCLALTEALAESAGTQQARPDGAKRP